LINHFVSFFRVLAQVSCDITKPKPNRQTEGLIFINIELSPMASPGFESGRYNIIPNTAVCATTQQTQTKIQDA